MGFTCRESDEHTLEEVEGIFDYLGENPTTSAILKVVHKITTNHTSTHRARKMSASLIEQELNSPVVQSIEGLGGPPSPLDDQFRESVDFANMLKKKMKMQPEELD